MLPKPTADVALVVTNFSGGKRLSRDHAFGRDELSELAKLASREGRHGNVVMAVQEMTTTDSGMPTRSNELEKAVDFGATTSYIPRVSTAWYPLAAKWNRQNDLSAAENEGLCVLSGVRDLTFVPWNEDASSSLSRVIDLPSFEFLGNESAPSPHQGWLRGTSGVDSHDAAFYFRPSYYQGSRDSDPRVAQACLLGWPSLSAKRRSVLGFVLINVHLSTLRREHAPRFMARSFSPEASFLRHAQLMVIAQFVREIRARSDIPLVVAGDFNAEPSSTELRQFSEASGLAPLLDAGVCWRCGETQVHRPRVTFYSHDESDLSLSAVRKGRRVPVLSTNAVCSNSDCLEPRFTHKRHPQLLDNVFISATSSGKSQLVPGIPRIELDWSYSDHGAIVIPLRLASDGFRNERGT